MAHPLTTIGSRHGPSGSPRHPDQPSELIFSAAGALRLGAPFDLLIFNEFRSRPLALEVELRVEVEVQERTTIMADTRSFELEASPGRVTGSTVISVSGPLVLENLFRFQNAWRSDESPIVVFDLSEVDYMDSSAIGSLVNAHVHLSRNGRKMALAGVGERLKQILTITKVDSLFRFYPTTSDAEAALLA